MPAILVTGHCGWIGTNFTKLLDLHRISWIGLDQVEGNDLLKSIDPFNKAVKHCDIVVHLAATPRIPASWEQADHYRNNNVGVTDQIARICAQEGKYLIFASSSSVYGNGNGPLNPYAWTKLAGEQSIEMYARSQNLKYTILRFFTNYGSDGPDTLVIGKWLSKYKRNESLTLRGSGTQSRDFIHVTDTASALLACCEQHPYGKTLDIGTGRSYNLKEIINLFNSTITVEQELVGYAVATLADIEATQQSINWQPRVELISWVNNELQTIKKSIP
jgi:nucleoside-diphosphate-sugar epimerase